jgi:hypothetical protein
MNYMTRNTTLEVEACMHDSTQKSIYTHLDERSIRLPICTAKYIRTETSCGLCEYMTEYTDDYDDYSYDNENERARYNYSTRKYLQSIRLRDLYSIFIESETEEDTNNILLKSDVELKDVRTLLVHVVFEETRSNGTYTEYRDFAVNKYAAEKWRNLSDKKKEILEDDFRCFIFNETLPSKECTTTK